jgi:hypothetical protein
MKKFISIFLLFLFLLSLNSCQAIGDIFKAGVWVGIFIVVAVIGLIIYLVIGRGSNKN